MKFRRSNTTCLERYDYKNLHSNHGIGLEIMALDVVSDVPLEQRQQAAQVGKYQRLLWAASHETDLYKIRISSGTAMPEGDWQCLKQEASEYTQEELVEYFLKSCQQYVDKDSGKMALYLLYNQGDRYRIFDSKLFADTVLMDFAGLRLPAPKGFWVCLQKFYGKGFMGYAAYNNRKPHHPAIWDAKVPYSVWQKRILDLYDVKEKKVVVFGTGNMAEKFIKQLAGRLMVTNCVDNNDKSWGKLFMGYEVKSPEILKTEPEKWHVIVANGYYREIGEQLESMGVHDYYVYVDDWRALFGAPGEYSGDKGSVEREYNIAGVFVKNSILTSTLIMKIRELKACCEYLVVFCDDEDMARCLREVRSINRTVYTTSFNKEIKNKYCCDIIFEV